MANEAVNGARWFPLKHPWITPGRFSYYVVLGESLPDARHALEYCERENVNSPNVKEITKKEHDDLCDLLDLKCPGWDKEVEEEE